MTAAERVVLLHGPYRTPKARIGRMVIVDEVRGVEVVVVGLTNARIPWPIGKPRHGRARAPVVYGDLERAVKLESNQTVCHWWGVSSSHGNLSEMRPRICWILPNQYTQFCLLIRG